MKRLEPELATLIFQYGREWDVSVDEISVTQRRYRWRYLQRCLHFVSAQISNDEGHGTVKVSCWAGWNSPWSPRIDCFWYKPKGDTGIMLPPWAAFQGACRFNQGFEEEYLCEWVNWYESKTRLEREAYQLRFPGPTTTVIPLDTFYDYYIGRDADLPD